jgi:hypothetical protein
VASRRGLDRVQLLIGLLDCRGFYSAAYQRYSSSCFRRYYRKPPKISSKTSSDTGVKKFQRKKTAEKKTEKRRKNQGISG